MRFMAECFLACRKQARGVSSAWSQLSRIELRDVAELLLPCSHQSPRSGLAFNSARCFLRTDAQHSRFRPRGPLNSLRRLGDNLIHATHCGNFGRGDAHGFGGRLLVRRIPPHDGGAGLRSNHKIQRIFENQHAVADCQGQRSARSALAADDRNRGHAQARHFAQIAGDRFSLAALLRSDAGIRAGQDR